MIDILKKASENFAEILGLELKECSDKNIRGYVSKIEIKGDKNLDVYVVLPTQKLELVSEVLLGDKDAYEVDDLSKEIANLIVGNSKVVAGEKDINFNISTPEFLGEYKGDINFDEFKCFEVNGIEFFILIKEK
ncbi:chemotaxis protein CheX [Caminibacter sp.]